MATTTETTHGGADVELDVESQLQQLLSRVRKIDVSSLNVDKEVSPNKSIARLLSRYSKALSDTQKTVEAEALDQVREKVIDRKAFGGLGLGDETAVADASQQAEVIFLVEAWLEAINSKERAKDFLTYRSKPAEGTKPMTLTQKIFAQHVVGEKPASGLASGDVVRVGVDWILASELSWAVGRRLQLLAAACREILTSPRVWPGRTKNSARLGFGVTTDSGLLVTTLFILRLRKCPKSKPWST